MKYVNLNDHKENKIKREMIESELNFLGFILIHNKLKKETKQTIPSKKQQRKYSSRL